MFRDGEGAECFRNFCRTFVFAFLWLFIWPLIIHDDGILAKERMRLCRVTRLEDSKSILELTDSITHASNTAVQVLGSGNDEAYDEEDWSRVDKS